MMNGHIEHEIPTDVVFLIEATAMNGIYINELKTNYVQPILEHFNQGPFENNENSCDNRNCLYTIVLYHAPDIRPKPCCRTYVQEKDPHFVLSVIEKVRLAGGKAQSTANLVEGLACCLQFFDDIKSIRDGCQKYCVLICNSPPNMMPVMENDQYTGNHLEQLASLFGERKIMMSILASRKIPALFKLFEKTGGDLSIAQSKNYSKNGRHLVLLNGLCLKERAISPSTNVPPTHVPSPRPNPVPASVGSPTPVTHRTSTGPQTPATQIQHADINSQQSIQPQPAQQQTPPQQLHPQHPQQQKVQQQQQPLQQLQPQQQQIPQQQSNPQQQQQPQPPQLQQPGMPHAIQSSQMVVQQQPQQPPSQGGRILPSNFNASTNFPRMSAQPPGKWPTTMNTAGPRPQYNPNQPPSTLIAQLNQPIPSMPPQFSQNPALSQPNVNMINQSQNPQMNSQFSHQLQPKQQQPSPIRMVGGPMMNNPVQQMPMNPQMETNQVPNDRQAIWHGFLEFTDKSMRNPDEMPNPLANITRQVPCFVTYSVKEKAADLKPEAWPTKLVVQLLPRQMISNAGNQFLKKAHSVLFHPSPCEALDSLTKFMTNGLAGCVQFNMNNTAFDLKILILLYTQEKNLYLGFIPTEQQAFLDRLRKQINMRQNNQGLQQRQIQVAQNQNLAGSPAGPTAPSLQNQAAHLGGGMLPNPNMSNQMTGGQNHMGSMLVNEMAPGNVGPGGPMMQVPNNQPTVMHQNLNTMNVQPNVMGIARNNPAIMGSGPRIAMPASDPGLLQRQENLDHIRRLQQQLSAAQQQEQMYQKIEQTPYGRPAMVHVPQSLQQQAQPQRNIPNSVPNQPNPQFDDNSYDFI